MSADELARRAVAETVGTAFLLMAVVGSGVAASRLAPDEPALVLLVNSLVTGGALAAIILVLQSVSSALNPAVTLAEVLTRRVSPGGAAVLVTAQVAGAVIGVVLANLMFALPAISLSRTDRVSGAHLLAEVVATSGLVLVVLVLLANGSAGRIAPAVACYVTAAYWFTSSTSFANPAVTIARTLSDTYAGIAPPSALPFVAAQLFGVLLAVGLTRVLVPTPHPTGVSS